MDRKIQFVYLRNTKAVSLSGVGCFFNCAHCNKHYLKHMDTLLTDFPENTTSLLISGGLKKDGSSYILDKKEELLDLKKARSFKYNCHVGFVTPEDIKELESVVDFVSLDFVSDPSVIERVYKIKKTKQDYIDLYKNLSKKLKVYPHITIGIDGGKVHWEYEAVDILKDLGADRLVFNVLIPTPGTEFEGVDNPDLKEIEKLIKYAREVFKNQLLILGCMRPGGEYRNKLDKIAVSIGVDRIVQPTLEARNLAKEKGLEISILEECCVI